jgi:transposase
MATVEVSCKYCKSIKTIKNGYSSIADRRVQRYRCQDCKKSFQLDYTNPAYKSDTADKIVAMTLNGSGMRDIRRVLGVGFKTIQNTLKKKERAKIC